MTIILPDPDGTTDGAALAALRQYLTTTLASKYDDDVLLGVLQVEATDQNARIRTAYQLPALVDWDDHLAPLREAILRRCARNLALRKLPLGITESDVESLRIAGRDNEIRRFEAPYVRLVVG